MYQLINYTRISFRNFKKNWSYTLLNLLGLSLGMLCFILLISYTLFEQSFEDFHRKSDKVYGVVMERYKDKILESKYLALPPAFGNTVKQEIEGVEYVSRFFNSWQDNVVKYKEVIAAEKHLYYADSDFFKLFTFPLLKGNPETALQNPLSIILTQKMATKYFGKEDPMGKSIFIGNKESQESYTVTGIVSNIPENTELKFDLLASFTSLHTDNKLFETDWVWLAFPTYISIKKGYNPEKIHTQMPNYISKYKTADNDANRNWKFTLKPLKDIHLKTNFSNKAVNENKSAKAKYILQLIALLIIGISWINYVNLSTATASERAKEVGIRKYLGASKKQIITQFLVESALLNLLAGIIAILLSFMVIQPFSTLLNLEISALLFLQQPLVWVWVGLILIVGIFLSGLYPAIVLSSFKTIDILKVRTLTTPGNSILRKFLVGVQFGVSMLLISFTLVMIHQNYYMKSKDKGISLSNKIILSRPKFENVIKYGKAFNSFAIELRSLHGIENVSGSYGVPSLIGSALGVWDKSKGIQTQETHIINGVDLEYLNTYNLKLLTGRNFTLMTPQKYKNKKSEAIISLESMKRLGYKTPEEAIGKKIEFEILTEWDIEIVGVINDYDYATALYAMDGIILLQNIGFVWAPNYTTVKIDSHIKQSQAIVEIEKVYKKFFPGNLFDYKILEDEFFERYKREATDQHLFSVFSIIAIILACLGVAGLTSYIATLKTKEIALRKLFGANKTSISWVLSKEFAWILMISIIIILPFSFYLTHNWLKDYPYRISLQVWHYGLTLCIMTIITSVVIIANLAKALRKSIVSSLSR